MDEGTQHRGNGRTRSTHVAAAAGEEFGRLVSDRRATVLAARLEEAAVAFDKERFPEARKTLKAIVDEAPGSPSARELFGLTHYRLGNFREAAKQLESYRELVPGSTDQHPVLADCYRAQRKWSRVDELWRELREASPSADLVTEGRIVAAGALADRGRLSDAIRELEKGWKAPSRPKEHHLRRAYVLADLYERAGEIPRARATFGWIRDHAPDFVDVQRRLADMR